MDRQRSLWPYAAGGLYVGLLVVTCIVVAIRRLYG
jgi:hypothetical protein